MNLRPSLSETAVRRLVDPRTNTPLRPLGVVGGRTVWPIMGASPDDPAEQDADTTDEDKDKDASDADKDKDSSDSDKDTNKDGDPAAKIAALEDEKSRHVRRRQEAERERDELKARLEKLEAKDTPELDQVRQKAEKLESENGLLQEALKEARLSNAFLKDNTYTWHNPGRALKLADLSEVEIDDDGTVHGLKQALDKLAKSDPYLIKQGDKNGKDDDKPDTSKDSKNPSKKEKKTSSEEEQRKKLLEKYPALRR